MADHEMVDGEDGDYGPQLFITNTGVGLIVTAMGDFSRTYTLRQIVDVFTDRASAMDVRELEACHDMIARALTKLKGE